MRSRKRRIVGPAAVSAVALASLAGAPSAGAQIICEVCPPETGLGTAFGKLAFLKFPGETEEAFLKVGSQYAFSKLEMLGFPGLTEGIFDKFG